MTTRDQSDLSNSHAALLRDVAAGRLSRRAALKRGLALGLSAPALAGLLAARGAVPAVAQAQESKLKGKKIEMAILGIGGWPPSKLGVTLGQDLFVPYAKQTYGYDVSFTLEESPFDQLFQKAAASLATRSAEYNIIVSDSQWLGAFATAKWIVQVNDLIAKNPALNIQYPDVIRDAYQTYPVGSKDLWGFPQEGDVIALYVRKDLFSDATEQQNFKTKYGFALPQTFEDFQNLDMDSFQKIAEFFTRPDKGLYGTAMQLSKVYDYVSCYLYPFIWGTGGEIWNQDTETVTGILNTEANAKAMERMKAFIQYMPPGATNFGIPEEVDLWTKGKVATCFQWAAEGLDMITDKTKDTTLVMPPPGFKQADGTVKRVYTIGGQPWVINAFNDDDHMQVAIDYMKWWYQKDTQLEFAKRGGNPTTSEVLDSEGFEQIQPWYQTYKFMLQEGRSRDFWHDPKYSEMLSAQQEAFSAYMTGQVKDPLQALNYAACTQQKILHDAGRSQVAPPDMCKDVHL